MPDSIPAFDYLAAPADHATGSTCVVFGDDAYLKREALREVRRLVLGDDDDFSATVVAGRDAELRDLVDELSTVSMFSSGPRLVIVEEADEFVTRNRASLEDYLAKPARSGVLVLAVKTWPKTTRLFKTVAKSGLQIDCKGPTAAKLAKWLTGRAKSHHRTKLGREAAEAMVELVGDECGLLDQELARLALLATSDTGITAELVRQQVGSWRTQQTWDMIDAAVAGDACEALRQLDRLLLAGESPIGVLAQCGATLRRFAAATRLINQAEQDRRRVSLPQALEQAGVKKFALRKAEPQLRQLGRDRASHLYRWLLDADLALKGVSSSPDRARLVLEQLIVRLSREANPQRSASRA